MEYQKDKENNTKPLTKADFLRVLDRAINPIKSPDQEIGETLDSLLVVKGYSPKFI